MNRHIGRPLSALLLIWLFGAISVFLLHPTVHIEAADGKSTPVFENVWARAAGAGHMSAVYMDIKNSRTTGLSIVAARSDVAERVEVHETTMELTVQDGKVSQVMRMEEIDALHVDPGSVVQLQPGGLHIMLIGLTRDIEEGDRFTLELELGSGERFKLDVPVKIGLGDDDHDHHDH